MIIIGGGLSGLTAAWHLHKKGVDFLLLEARARLGGRARSLSLQGGHFDVGGTWLWPEHSTILQLLRDLDIQTFPQFSTGDAMFESEQGTVSQVSFAEPFKSTVRIRGGTIALVNALVARLPNRCIHLNTHVRALETDGNDIVVKADTNGNEIHLRARHVAIALPLRLASQCSFQPPLGETVMDMLRNTPTWMAGQAKFLAVYKTPFWRKRRLSGYAMSSKGTLLEVHDASIEGSGPFALFGFVAGGALSLAKDKEDFIAQSLTCLARLFGEEAKEPLEAIVVDWSKEKWTATSVENKPDFQHPAYRIQLPLDPSWNGRLDFIVSEMHHEHGGFMGGAVANGKRFADRFVEME